MPCEVWVEVLRDANLLLGQLTVQMLSLDSYVC